MRISKRKLSAKLISSVIAFTFLWTNCIYASGLSGFTIQNQYLAAQSQIKSASILSQQLWLPLEFQDKIVNFNIKNLSELRQREPEIKQKIIRAYRSKRDRQEITEEQFREYEEMIINSYPIMFPEEDNLQSRVIYLFNTKGKFFFRMKDKDYETEDIFFSAFLNKENIIESDGEINLDIFKVTEGTGGNKRGINICLKALYGVEIEVSAVEVVPEEKPVLPLPEGQPSSPGQAAQLDLFSPVQKPGTSGLGGFFNNKGVIDLSLSVGLVIMGMILFVVAAYSIPGLLPGYLHNPYISSSIVGGLGSLFGLVVADSWDIRSLKYIFGLGAVVFALGLVFQLVLIPFLSFIAGLIMLCIESLAGFTAANNLESISDGAKTAASLWLLLGIFGLRKGTEKDKSMVLPKGEPTDGEQNGYIKAGYGKGEAPEVLAGVKKKKISIDEFIDRYNIMDKDAKDALTANNITDVFLFDAIVEESEKYILDTFIRRNIETENGLLEKGIYISKDTIEFLQLIGSLFNINLAGDYIYHVANCFAEQHSMTIALQMGLFKSNYEWNGEPGKFFGIKKKDFDSGKGWLKYVLRLYIERRVTERLYFNAHTEDKTKKILADINERLRKKIDERERRQSKSDKQRDKIILWSMKGWLRSHICKWTLDNLGYKPHLRKVLSFLIPSLIPKIEWLCSRLILPIDVSLDDAEKAKREMERLAQVIKEKQKKNMMVVLDNVGDDAKSEKDAEDHVNYYINIIKFLGGRNDIKDVNLSLKFSALVYGYKEVLNSDSDIRNAKRDEIKQRLREILKAASSIKNKKVLITIDAEEWKYLWVSTDIYKEVIEENLDVARDEEGSLRLGVVIQGCLIDSGAVLDNLFSWAKRNNFRVPVRLVKGAYDKKEKEWAKKGGYSSPVFSEKESTDSNFELLAKLIISNKESFQISFGTHNIRSMAKVMALAESYGLRKDEYELQMLMGMGEEIEEVIANMGYQMRIYIPAGTLERGMKYTGRRFLELSNTDNALTRTLKGLYFEEALEEPEFQEGDAPTLKSYIPIPESSELKEGYLPWPHNNRAEDIIKSRISPPRKVEKPLPFRMKTVETIEPVSLQKRKDIASLMRGEEGDFTRDMQAYREFVTIDLSRSQEDAISDLRSAALLDHKIGLPEKQIDKETDMYQHKLNNALVSLQRAVKKLYGFRWTIPARSRAEGIDALKKAAGKDVSVFTYDGKKIKKDMILAEILEQKRNAETNGKLFVLDATYIIEIALAVKTSDSDYKGKSIEEIIKIITEKFDAIVSGSDMERDGFNRYGFVSVNEWTINKALREKIETRPEEIGAAVIEHMTQLLYEDLDFNKYRLEQLNYFFSRLQETDLPVTAEECGVFEIALDINKLELSNLTAKTMAIELYLEGGIFAEPIDKDNRNILRFTIPAMVYDRDQIDYAVYIINKTIQRIKENPNIAGEMGLGLEEEPDIKQVILPPFKAKVVEYINTRVPRILRWTYLKSVGWNEFALFFRYIIGGDWLTDSGTGSLDIAQLKARLLAKQDYAGAPSFDNLRDTVRDLFGYKYTLPCHQGRATEKVFNEAMIKMVKPGMIVPGNKHFDTTVAQIEEAKGRAQDISVSALRESESDNPFKGNVDIEELRKILEEQSSNVAYVLITATCNSGGGQPVSMENIRKVKELCKRYNKLLVIDAARYAENAYFIKEREPGYRDKPLREIILEMMSYFDVMLMSSKKEGLVNMGGFIALGDITIKSQGEEKNLYEVLEKINVRHRLRDEEFFDTLKKTKVRYKGKKRSLDDLLREIEINSAGSTVNIYDVLKGVMVNLNGQDTDLYTVLNNINTRDEGFPTYGGMNAEDLEALAAGLRESASEPYQRYRHEQIRYLANRFLEAGIPIVTPPGGHAVFIDARKFFDGRIPDDQYPAQTLTLQLYLEGGMRAVEIGQLLEGSDPNTGEKRRAPLDLVRITFPRRVYTRAHLDYVASIVKKVYERRDEITSGIKLTYEPPVLPHFNHRAEDYDDKGIDFGEGYKKYEFNNLSTEELLLFKEIFDYDSAEEGDKYYVLTKDGNAFAYCKEKEDGLIEFKPIEPFKAKEDEQRFKKLKQGFLDLIKIKKEVHKVPGEYMYRHAVQEFIRELEKVISEKGKAVVIFATGNTMLEFYKEVIAYSKEIGLGDEFWAKVIAFNLDEYVGLSPKHKASYRHYLETNFYNEIGIPVKNRHFFNVRKKTKKHLKKETERIEQELINCGGPDIVMLGIGKNGHIAFNEPGIALNSGTHIAELKEETRRDNAGKDFGNNWKKVPPRAITMGVAAIMSGRKIFLLATGGNKTDAINKALKGKVTTGVPVSVLQRHKNVTFIVDEEAGRDINETDIGKFKIIYAPESNPKRLNGLTLADGTVIRVLQDVSYFPSEALAHWDNHYAVFEIKNEKLDYTAYMAIHRLTKIKSKCLTVNGQWRATGGTRIMNYKSNNAALADALELAWEMSHKNAGQGLKIGGSKCVINVKIDPRADGADQFQRRRILINYARAIEEIGRRIGGGVLTGQDMNITPQDADLLAEYAPTSLVPHIDLVHNRPPAPPTGAGVFAAIGASVSESFPDKPALEGKIVAIQGVGGTGGGIIKPLLEAGAIVIASDVNEEAFIKLKNGFKDKKSPLYFPDFERYAKNFYYLIEDEITVEKPGGEKVISYTKKILNPGVVISHTGTPVKVSELGKICVFSPCAKGPVIDLAAVEELKRAGVKVVCGACNNVLEDKVRDAKLLTEAGIIYVPDYIANAGGVTGVDGHMIIEEYKNSIIPDEAISRRIANKVKEIITIAMEEGRTTQEVADTITREFFERLERVDSEIIGASAKLSPISKIVSQEKPQNIWEAALNDDGTLSNGEILDNNEELYNREVKEKQGILNDALQKIKEKMGEGIFTAVNRIRVVHNLKENSVSGVAPYTVIRRDHERNGIVVLYLDSKALNDFNLLYLEMDHALQESIMIATHYEDEAIRELASNYMTLKKAIREGIEEINNVENLDPDNNFLKLVPYLQKLQKRRQDESKELNDSDIIAVLIEHMRVTPYYIGLFILLSREYKFQNKWIEEVANSVNRFESALGVFNEIAYARNPLVRDVKITEERMSKKQEERGSIKKKELEDQGIYAAFMNILNWNNSNIKRSDALFIDTKWQSIATRKFNGTVENNYDTEGMFKPLMDLLRLKGISSIVVEDSASDNLKRLNTRFINIIFDILFSASETDFMGFAIENDLTIKVVSDEGGKRVVIGSKFRSSTMEKLLGALTSDSMKSELDVLKEAGTNENIIGYKVNIDELTDSLIQEIKAMDREKNKFFYFSSLGEIDVDRFLKDNGLEQGNLLGLKIVTMVSPQNMEWINERNEWESDYYLALPYDIPGITHIARKLTEADGNAGLLRDRDRIVYNVLVSVWSSVLEINPDSDEMRRLLNDLIYRRHWSEIIEKVKPVLRDLDNLEKFKAMTDMAA